jgi:hypothetical protein
MHEKKERLMMMMVMRAMRARWQKRSRQKKMRVMRRPCSCDVFPEKTLHQYSFDNNPSKQATGTKTDGAR